MYKAWLKAVLIGIIVMFCAFFLEFEIEGSQNFEAKSFYLEHENKLFGFKYSDFEFLKFLNFKKTVKEKNILGKKDCQLTDVKMVDGQKGFFYSQKFVPAGTSCDLYRQERKCVDGILSGDKRFKYKKCEIDTKKDCEVSGHKIFHGKSEIFYKNSNASVNKTCSDLSQKRFCVNGKMTGNTDYNKTKCTSVTDTECFFLGKKVEKNSIFYKEPFVDFGNECSLQLRSCKEGKLTGRYEYETCTVKPPKSCFLGLTEIENNKSKIFYKTNKVSYGDTCQSQVRTCLQGVLSGSDDYKESFCSPAVPKICKVGEQWLLHGESKLFYNIKKAKAGEVCKPIKRSCNNGKVSGDKNYVYEKCISFKKKSCELDGITIKDGEFIDFYKNSEDKFCKPQKRSCEDGVLKGDENYNKSSCRRFKDCWVADNQIKHNAGRIFYKNHTVPKNSKCKEELRTCSDGNLSGTFNNLYCSTEENIFCFFSGIKIDNNKFKVFYSKEHVPYGETCEKYSKKKFCLNGTIKGETKYVYSSCKIDEKLPEQVDLNCYLNGETIRNKMSKYYYKNDKVPYGTDCQSEKRVCKDGKLSGSFTNKFCKIEKGESCFVGKLELKDKESKFFYSKSKVSEGDYCKQYKQKRTCNNGTMTGDDIYYSLKCEDFKPKSCKINNIEIKDGEFQKFYSTEKVLDENECKSQVRVCDDGELFGDDKYKYISCKKKSSCKLWNGEFMQNGSRVFYKNHTVENSSQCKYKENRICDDGVLSGSYTNQYCYAIKDKICFYGGLTIREGTYKVFYSKNKVEEGEKCKDFSKKKYCLGGKINSDEEYIYSSCVENN